MSEIRSDIPPSTSPRRRFPRWLLIAAVVVTAAVGGVFLLDRPNGGQTVKSAPVAARQEWYCPMHPQVVSDKP